MSYLDSLISIYDWIFVCHVGCWIEFCAAAAAAVVNLLMRFVLVLLWGVSFRCLFSLRVLYNSLTLIMVLLSFNFCSFPSFPF